MKVTTNTTKVISDTVTPVSVFLRVRNVYSKVFLLESSDYKGSDNSFSYICFDPVSSIQINNFNVSIDYNNTVENHKITKIMNSVIYLRYNITLLLIIYS